MQHYGEEEKTSSLFFCPKKKEPNKKEKIL